MRRLFGLIFLVCLILLDCSALSMACNRKGKVEILWDEWGVPHIYGNSVKQLVYGLSWAQMHNHGNWILRLYGISRGRAAEYWGEEHLKSDRYVWTMLIPQLARQQYIRLNYQERQNVDAFAKGINDYAMEHGDMLDEDLKAVLPLRGLDVVQHLVYATLILPNATQIENIIQEYSDQNSASTGKSTRLEVNGASNGWVIGPGKSLSGKPMLLSNTHFPWPNLPGYEHVIWHEAHVVGQGIDHYGIGLVGVPALTLGFNDKKAWTITMAPNVDRVDTYELTKLDNGYLFNGRKCPFKRKKIRLWVKQDDGSLRESQLEIKASVHGPVIFETDDHALALRVAVPNKIAGSQLWDMAKADNYDDFIEALEGQNLPPLNILYADREDNILYTMVGPYPDRKGIKYDPSNVISGNSSKNLWRGLLPFDRMPLVLNPDSEFLQNANEPPWSTTLPSELNPEDFPQDWPQSRISLRAARILKTLMSEDVFSFDDVINDKFSNHSELADRVLDDLIKIGRADDDPSVQQVTNVLANWDRTFDSDSLGATAFAFWLMVFLPSPSTEFPDTYYAHPYDQQNPLSTPNGLKDSSKALQALKTASQALNGLFGSFHVPWGEIFRFRLAGLDLPGHGAPGAWGVLCANTGIPQADGSLLSSVGDTWVFAVDFADPDNAMAVTSYSNATQPGSVHLNDQLPLYAEKRLRKVWRTYDEILAHTEFQETIKFPVMREQSRND